MSAERPGVLRRLAAGAWHVPAGFSFLIRNPGLWPMAILPVILAAVLLFGGLVLGAFAFPRVEAAVLPGRDRVPDWLSFVMSLVLWAGTLAAGMALGLAVALLLSAPVLERLSRRVEARLQGEVVDRSRGLPFELAQSLRGGVYFLAAAPGIFLLGLVPLLGPVLGAFWGAHVLAFQETEAPLSRRGLDFRARRDWHRRWRPESLGFGLAGLITLLVPVANLLLAPVLAVGGTLLALELESVQATSPEPQPGPQAGSEA